MNVLPAQAAVPGAAPGLGPAEQSGAVPRGAWPLPPLAQMLSLGDSRLTRLYWAGVGLLAAGFCVTQLLPCVDYPQHLALSDVARRLMVPGSPEHEQYELNYFTYNGLFHILVARLGAFVPIELAGRSVVVFSVVATAGAVVALVRVLRRPPEYAALFTPILFSYALVWGFVNYVLATAIAAWALVFVARFVVKPSVGAWLALGALGALCAFAHVLAMLALCLAAAALAIELSWRVGARPAARWPALRVLVRAAVALAPLLVGCAFCIAVYRQQFPWDPNMYRDPTMEGTAPPLWQKLVYFSAFATNLFDDVTDQVVLWASILVMGIAVRVTIASRRAGTLQREPSPPIVAPFVVLTGAYFATPMVLIGTHLIFPRLAQWSILGAILATPRYPVAEAMARARRWVPRLGVLAGANAFIHCAVFAYETRDASATIDDLPAGGAATAVLWDPDTESFRNGPLTHMAAYYAARKHGRWAFAFARYLSVPVRFRPFTQPAWPEQGWEFDGEAYDPRCKYARAFPLVIVKAPEDLPHGAEGEAAIRAMIFHADARAVKLLSHHGEYWAFDTEGLADDGKF